MATYRFFLPLTKDLYQLGIKKPGPRKWAKIEASLRISSILWHKIAHAPSVVKCLFVFIRKVFHLNSNEFIDVFFFHRSPRCLVRATWLPHVCVTQGRYVPSHMILFDSSHCIFLLTMFSFFFFLSRTQCRNTSRVSLVKTGWSRKVTIFELFA